MPKSLRVDRAASPLRPVASHAGSGDDRERLAEAESRRRRYRRKKRVLLLAFLAAVGSVTGLSIAVIAANDPSWGWADWTRLALIMLVSGALGYVLGRKGRPRR